MLFVSTTNPFFLRESQLADSAIFGGILAAYIGNLNAYLRDALLVASLNFGKKVSLFSECI